VEKEREIAIAETKKKKWVSKVLLYFNSYHTDTFPVFFQCSSCYKEALYHCCCFADYCSEECQKAHWDKHSSECQAGEPQQPPGPAKPAPAGVPGGAPVDATAEAHGRVSGGLSNATESHGPVLSGPGSEAFLQTMQPPHGQQRIQQQHQAVSAGDQGLGTGRMSPANMGLIGGVPVSSQVSGSKFGIVFSNISRERRKQHYTQVWNYVQY